MFFKSNKNLIAIFLSSFIIYLLSCFGLFDGLSAVVANKLPDFVEIFRRVEKG
jgi:hypothetical protein